MQPPLPGSCGGQACSRRGDKACGKWGSTQGGGQGRAWGLLTHPSEPPLSSVAPPCCNTRQRTPPGLCVPSGRRRIGPGLWAGVSRVRRVCFQDPMEPSPLPACGRHGPTMLSALVGGRELCQTGVVAGPDGAVPAAFVWKA